MLNSYLVLSETLNRGSIGESTGIVMAKRFLNQLHRQLSQKGFSQVQLASHLNNNIHVHVHVHVIHTPVNCAFQIFVDQKCDDVISVVRHNPTNHQSVVLVARSAFSKNSNPDDAESFSVNVQGKSEAAAP